MRTEERLLPKVIERLRDAIVDAGGNEVFAVGRLNADGMVAEIKIAARGDESSVPVIEPHIKHGDVVLHNHPSGVLSPSSADMLIAYRLGNQGVGFYIIDNNVDNLYAVAEPVKARTLKPIQEKELADTLEPGGRFEKIFPGYEPRESQIDMLRLVSRSLNQNRICIAEAGTGVGKSMAYLLPALKWVAENDERIVVSTGTINLQQQLMEKDIPLANKALGLDKKAVLVKGKSNYLCKTRLREAMAEANLFKEENDELENIAEWSAITKEGSKSDLSFNPSPQVWGQVCSESDLCLGLRCLYREDCFVLKARREASTANLLIVNHHLLFADLALRASGMGYENTAILPPFRRIVFDEAHNVEASVTSYFSESFSRYSLLKYLSRLFTQKRGRRFGLIIKLEPFLPSLEKLKEVPALITSITTKITLLEGECLTIMGDFSSYYLKDLKENKARLFDPLFNLVKEILKLCTLFEEILDSVDSKEKENLTVFETGLQIKRLKNIASLGNKFRDYEDSENEIYWMEKIRGRKEGASIRFVITPLDVAPVMQDSVYEPCSSITFTSATLSVNGSFQYWKTRLGLVLREQKTENDAEEKKILEGQFPSPFDYKNNVLLGVPQDAPLPNDDRYQDYITRFIKETIKLSEGRALVLFTSYQMLNQAYQDLRDFFEEMKITVFRQGDDDRSRLLNKFKTDISSVLFATDSFWEGIDTPGEALEVVIICKLPFRVPTDPIIRARTEDLERRGENSFFQYSLPEAVIKLKQGFGRLMRRGDDKGIILILDSRLVQKSYGQAFINSLPETERCIATTKGLLRRIEEFIVDMRTG